MRFAPTDSIPCPESIRGSARPDADGGPRTLPGGQATRLPWRSPRLEVLGDLRGLTLGGSPGGGDSGVGAAVELPFGFNP